MTGARRHPACIVCRRRIGANGELLYYRPDGTAVYLCGRKACADKYNGADDRGPVDVGGAA